jgi:hypothetical protein
MAARLGWMGNVRFGIPGDLAQALLAACNLRAAIETGTYRGESAVFLRSLCNRVWSIELSPTHHEEAVTRYGTLENLEFILGDSGRVLPGLLASCDEPALFWLDGHAMPGNSAAEVTECPILAELEAIDAWEHSGQSCILIDDAILFLAGPRAGLRADDWPTILQVIDVLRSHHERYVTVLDDVVIAGPPHIRPVVDEWWSRVVGERGGTTTMVPLQQLDRAWNPTPREAMRRLGKAVVSPFRRTSTNTLLDR